MISKLRTCEVTYETDDIFNITYELFRWALDMHADELSGRPDKPALFNFYDRYISEPLEELKERPDRNRSDFYELISIMSWALYRDFVKSISDADTPSAALQLLSKDKIIDLFIQNLDCEEGQDLLALVIRH